MYSVKRDSPANRLIDMLSRARDLIEEMTFNEQLRQ